VVVPARPLQQLARERTAAIPLRPSQVPGPSGFVTPVATERRAVNPLQPSHVLVPANPPGYVRPVEPMEQTSDITHENEGVGAILGANSESGSGSTITSTDDKKCFIILNEILVSNRLLSTFEFIEVAEKCGLKAKRKDTSTKLEGYVLLVLKYIQMLPEGILKLHIVFTMLLNEHVLSPSKGASSNSENYYFTVGSKDEPNIKFDLTFSKATHINSRQQNQRGTLPLESDSPSIVVLMKFKKKDYTPTKLSKLSLAQSAPPSMEYVPKPMTRELFQLIETNIIDLFAYGTAFNAEQESDIRSLWKDLPVDLSGFMYSSESHVLPESTNPISFSRCGQSNKPFQPASFVPAEATPGRDNICRSQRSDLVYPFTFKGTAFQRTAMKLMMNLRHSIKLAKSDHTILEGGPSEVAARLLGVSRRTVSRVCQRADQPTILTPKKKSHPKRVISAIDGFDRDFVVRTITDQFKLGIAPDAKRIYDAFMKMKRDTEASANRNAPGPSPPFQCSLKTFKRLLRLMGYRFKKIDDRAAIVQRPDLTKWRGIHLKKLRDNDALAVPKKLVYIDEVS
jgi:hypothetical protein